MPWFSVTPRDDDDVWSAATPRPSPVPSWHGDRVQLPVDGHNATLVTATSGQQQGFFSLRERDEKLEDELRDEHRAACIRGLVCAVLCAVAAVGVVVCIALALTAPRTPRNHGRRLLEVIQRSNTIEFTILPKPHTKHLTFGRTREETTDFYGIVRVNGRLLPRLSEDTGRVRFDGWFQVQTNESVVSDYFLARHRGIRVTQSESRCLNPTDFIPIHNLHEVLENAFEAQHYDTFRLNCSRLRPPLEIVFHGIPMLACADDFFSSVNDNTSFSESKFARSLVVHGEKLLFQGSLVGNERVDSTSFDATESWDLTIKPQLRQCPYLEAPMFTSRDKPLAKKTRPALMPIFPQRSLTQDAPSAPSRRAQLNN